MNLLLSIAYLNLCVIFVQLCQIVDLSSALDAERKKDDFI